MITSPPTTRPQTPTRPTQPPTAMAAKPPRMRRAPSPRIRTRAGSSSPRHSDGWVGAARPARPRPPCRRRRSRSSCRTAPSCRSASRGPRSRRSASRSGRAGRAPGGGCPRAGSVYSWISPPPSERSSAIRLPPRPRLRTTSPKTMPFDLDDAVAGEERGRDDDHVDAPRGDGAGAFGSSASPAPRRPCRRGTGSGRAAARTCSSRCGGRRPRSGRSRSCRPAATSTSRVCSSVSVGAAVEPAGQARLAAAERARAQPAQRARVVGGLVAVGPVDLEACRPRGRRGSRSGSRSARRTRSVWSRSALSHAALCPPAIGPDGTWRIGADRRS